jgi:hypothetical protein
MQQVRITLERTVSGDGTKDVLTVEYETGQESVAIAALTAMADEHEEPRIVLPPPPIAELPTEGS